MSIGRRGFLQRIGVAALAVVSVPFYIPSERLDFGVPKRLVTLDEVQIPRFVFDPQGFLNSLGGWSPKDLRQEDWRRFDADLTVAERSAVELDARTGRHFHPVTKAWLAQSRGQGRTDDA